MHRLLIAGIFCIPLLVVSPLLARTPGDLTGVHKTLRKCDSSDGTVSGPAYMHPCYEGFTHELGMRYALVQNGQAVCGSFESCGGWNCSKVYSGEVVGVVRGKTVTLYSANGHRENGDAEVEIFDISPNGELLVQGKGKRAYSKTSPGVITPAEKALCRPEFNEPVRLKDYSLEIRGTRPSLSNFEPKEKPVFHPPKAYTVKLGGPNETIRIKDGLRSSGNLIPRSIWIHNPTSMPWTVSTESTPNSNSSDEACSMWLETSEKKSNTYIWAYGTSFPLETIPPKSVRYTRLCSGDLLTIEKVLPECPKFQCLRTCRC